MILRSGYSYVQWNLTIIEHTMVYETVCKKAHRSLVAISEVIVARA